MLYVKHENMKTLQKKLVLSVGRRNAAFGQPAYFAVSSTCQAFGRNVPMHSYEWCWQPCYSYHTTQDTL
jgi:hypothetical protein